MEGDLLFLCVSIPERDYRLLQRIPAVAGSLPLPVSIPERDYRLLQLIFDQKMIRAKKFQSLKGIIGYCNPPVFPKALSVARFRFNP